MWKLNGHAKDGMDMNSEVNSRDSFYNYHIKGLDGALYLCSYLNHIKVNNCMIDMHQYTLGVAGNQHGKQRTIQKMNSMYYLYTFTN